MNGKIRNITSVKITRKSDSAEIELPTPASATIEHDEDELDKQTWQVYLESEKEWVDVYRRLAES